MNKTLKEMGSVGMTALSIWITVLCIVKENWFMTSMYGALTVYFIIVMVRTVLKGGDEE